MLNRSVNINLLKHLLLLARSCELCFGDNFASIGYVSLTINKFKTTRKTTLQIPASVRKAGELG